MFRVIIADDENRIVKMLAASIPWTKLGLSRRFLRFGRDGSASPCGREKSRHHNHGYPNAGAERTGIM